VSSIHFHSHKAPVLRPSLQSAHIKFHSWRRRSLTTNVYENKSAVSRLKCNCLTCSNAEKNRSLLRCRRTLEEAIPTEQQQHLATNRNPQHLQSTERQTLDFPTSSLGPIVIRPRVSHPRLASILDPVDLVPNLPLHNQVFYHLAT
jgi:hypothetical protein